MFYSTLLIAAAALCGLVSAQNYSTSGGNLTVVPDSVPLDLRQAWCRGQRASCPEICGGDASQNLCFDVSASCNTTRSHYVVFTDLNVQDTLTYQCVCADGSHPNISDFDQTLPSFICAQWVIDCTAAHPNDLSGQTACQSVKCGMRNASAVPQSGPGGSQSSAAPSSSASATGGGGSKTSSGSASSATNTGAAAALGVGKSYGTGILAVAFAAVFGLAL